MTSSSNGSGQKPTRAVRPPPELVEKSRRDSQRPTRRMPAVGDAPPRRRSPTSSEDDFEIDVDAGWFELED